MTSDRSAPLMDKLTRDTVLGDLIKPVKRALNRVRYNPGSFTSISMMDFITIGVVRHLQGIATLRETVQFLFHHSDGITVPVPRSTFSDALASANRLQVLRDLGDPLLMLAAEKLPNRLASLPGIKQRPVYAMDGSYQKESAHFKKVTPKQGGTHSSKGHCMLSFYDVRLGCPCDAHISINSEHELVTMRDYDQGGTALTQKKDAIWLVDRAFIDSTFWDKKKQLKKITMITQMKSSLLYEPIEQLTISDNDFNDGVISDETIALNSSKKPWRLITYRTRREAVVEFLTNDFTLEPGIVAFLYSRRWEEEKCFDTWKNDFAQSKAWGKSIKSIQSQVHLAIITSILVAMLVHDKTGKDGTVDEKSINKQVKRQASLTDGTDRPDWSLRLFRFTTKVSKQVLRFLKLCLFKISLPRLYRTQLRPMLIDYL